MQPKVKLLDQVRAVARMRHLSHRTEDVYHNFIKRCILFHGKRHPNEMGADEISEFLTHLAVAEKVSASTQNQAFFALLFLYRDVLRITLPKIENVLRAKRPERVPVVFTPKEAKAILANLAGVPLLVASLLYGAGLRLTEALRLRKLSYFPPQFCDASTGKSIRYPNRPGITRTQRRADDADLHARFEKQEFCEKPVRFVNTIISSKTKKREILSISRFFVSLVESFQYFINSAAACSTSSICGRMKSSTCGA